MGGGACDRAIPVQQQPTPMLSIIANRAFIKISPFDSLKSPCTRLTLGTLFVKRRIVERTDSKYPLLFVSVAVAAVAIRFIWISQPFVDTWSWRQSDVAAIARNYSQNSFQFAYPQIDWSGGGAGYVGTEFPILPFLTAISYKLLGIHEWIGRFESVLFFALSLPF